MSRRSTRAEQLLREWGAEMVRDMGGLGGTPSIMWVIERYAMRPARKHRRSSAWIGSPEDGSRRQDMATPKQAGYTPPPPSATESLADKVDRVIATLNRDLINAALYEWAYGPKYNMSQDECARKVGCSRRTYISRVNSVRHHMEGFVNGLLAA